MFGDSTVEVHFRMPEFPLSKDELNAASILLVVVDEVLVFDVSRPDTRLFASGMHRGFGFRDRFRTRGLPTRRGGCTWAPWNRVVPAWAAGFLTLLDRSLRDFLFQTRTVATSQWRFPLWFGPRVTPRVLFALPGPSYFNLAAGGLCVGFSLNDASPNCLGSLTGGVRLLLGAFLRSRTHRPGIR